MSAFLLAIPRRAGLVSLDRAAALMMAAGGPRPAHSAQHPSGRGSGADSAATVAGHTATAVATELPTAQIIVTGGANAWCSEAGDVLVCSGAPELVCRSADGLPWSEPVNAESLAAAWQAGGTAALDELVGPHAVALWDADRGELRLQVDSLNIESLFVRVTPEALLVSTEVTPLLAARSTAQFDPDALQDIVRFRFLAGSRSCWQGVQQVTAGRRTVLRRDGSRHEEPSPRVHFGEPNPRWTVGNATERLEAALRGNLERLRDSGTTDVAVFVSGGIDSAVLAALAKRIFPRCTAVTFEVDGFPNPELDRAKEVARRLELRMQVARVQEGDVQRLYPWIIGRVQEPPLHYNNPIIVRMLEEVREIAPVVLSGDVAGLYGMGLHGGLRRRVSRAERLAAVPMPLRNLAAEMLRSTGVPRLRRAATLLQEGMPQHIQGIRAQQLHPEAAAALPECARVPAPSDDFLAHVYRTDCTYEDAGVLWSERVVEGSIFRRNTRFGAALDVRYHYPLADVAAMELITATSPELRFDTSTGLNKPLLRALCERYLGSDVTGWSKLGLPSPEREWMEGPLAPFLRDSFADNSLLAPFVDVRAMRALPLAPHQATFWTLMTLHEVLRQGTDIMAA